MKTRFSTIDILAVLHDLQKFVGMRVNNVYDIDSKTYLIKLMKPDAKGMILFESGNCLYSTEFDWPKSMMPSSFSMKLRKHIKQKRLESIRQVGADRIVQMQFGSGEVACHVFVELYDRGNVVLTDYKLTILNVLRPRTDKDTDVRFVVKERYPIEMCRQWDDQSTTMKTFDSEEKLREIFNDAKIGDNLRKILSPKFQYGPALLDHSLLEVGFRRDCKFGPDNDNNEEKPGVFRLVPNDLEKLRGALLRAESIFLEIRDQPCHGYVTYKSEKRMADGQEIEAYDEFHPYLFSQHSSSTNPTSTTMRVKEFSTFNAAVDDFFSKMETQKLDLKALQQEKVALKKCDNIRKDHELRINELRSAQDNDRLKAELIVVNKSIVDRAILVIRSAVANQLSWEEISELVEEAREQGDPSAMAIKKLKLETSQITMALPNSQFAQFDEEEDDGDQQNADNPGPSRAKLHQLVVDIDLNLNSHQNARKYFDHKKQAATKEQKTLEASKKAMRAAESKMHETLKQVQVKTSIMKSRKTYWFEKFFWFLSSDDHLVIGGRDAQQNELLVKRYFRPGDIYVHADIRGASSVIVKNPNPSSDQSVVNDPPPRTLQEAGTMAVCYSAAWEAKVVTSAWWVRHDQVSKTAPSGEYLTTGSFMIRGKKNFLPPCQLVMGFGVLFRLDEESIPVHRELKRQQRLVREESIGGDSSIQGGESIGGEEEETELKVESGESDIDEDGRAIEPKLDDEANMESNGGDQSKKPSDEDENDQEPKEEDEEEHEEEEMEFPDVAVNLRHLTTSESHEEMTVLQLGPKRPSATNQGPPPVAVDPKSKPTNEPKRGQRQKQKKIKEKYKDQDDEERQLRLQLLGSAGGEKDEKKKGGKKGKAAAAAAAAAAASSTMANQQKKGNQQQKPKKPPATKENVFLPSTEIPMADESKSEAADPPSSKIDQQPEIAGGQHQEDEEENSQWNVEIAGAQEALTGLPLDEDILLFSVPMCAPYSALQNLKYKVKLTPGTGKRGQATKTALAVFLRDKTARDREKELMKAMQDQDLARNLPGKVKVSAPQLTAVKRKK